MTFRLKETLYIKEGEEENIVRIGTSGFTKKGIVYFPDVTGTKFVGFSKNSVIAMKDLFKVTTVKEDVMVHLDDITKALGETEGMSKELQDEFLIKLSAYGV